MSKPCCNRNSSIGHLNQIERHTMQTNRNTGVPDSETPSEVLKESQFRIHQVQPGGAVLVGDAVVFNVAGSLCATQAKCTHRGGPLNEGKLDGATVTCAWHGAQFDVCTGAVSRGPATERLKIYRVVGEGDTRRLEKDN